MLLGGDEIGRTQGGNNNAWCQDNEISWFDWERRATRELLEFTRAADPRCGSEHPVFRRAAFLSGREVAARGCPTSGGSGPTAAG